MKIEGITLSTTSLRPDRIEASSPTVSNQVPNQAGAYLLFIGEYPVYVGRSDSSLKARLESHEHLPVATHLAWKVRESAEGAFYLEAAWFHQGGETEHMLNKVHPGAPAGASVTCPFCEGSDDRAFQRAADRMMSAV